MFEIGIFFVIVLAVSYWAVLWTMGRREDVLHGEFVENDPRSNEPMQSSMPEPPPATHFPCAIGFHQATCFAETDPCSPSDLPGLPFRINRRLDRNGCNRCSS